MRAYVATIILALVACALAASLLARPVEPPLAADAKSPGRWRFEAQAASPAAPQLLFALCPLTPKNLPPVSPERRA